MATIQDYLDLIKNAIYGKDVRQAIHDGIQQCYYDGKAGSTDLEARQRLDTAEGSISSLGSRMSTAENDIDVLDSRVDEIVAPSGQAPSAAEVTDARVGANGQTYTSLGGAIRGQVTDLKNEFDNLVDGEEILFPTPSMSMGTIDGSTGEASTSTTGKEWITDYVESDNLVKMVASSDGNGAYFTYDSNKNFISGITFNSGTTESLNHSGYIRFYVHKNDWDVINEATARSYITLKEANKIDQRIDVCEKKIDAILYRSVDELKIGLFEKGGLSNGVDDSYGSANRIRTPLLCAINDIVISALTTSYENAMFGIATFSDDGDYQSDSGWLTSATIAKGTIFRLVCSADVTQFVEKTVSEVFACFEFSANKGDLKDVFMLKDLKFMFEHGGIDNGVNNSWFGNARARTINQIVCDNDIIVHWKDGVFGIAYYKDDGTFIGQTGWLSSDKMIPANQKFRIAVTPNPNVSTYYSLEDILECIEFEEMDGKDFGLNPNIIWQSRNVDDTFYPPYSKWYIQAAAKNQYDRVRFNIRKTTDGYYFLCHDDTINQEARNADGSTISTTITTNGHTLAELNAYDWGIKYGTQYKGAEVPMLEDALKYSSMYNLGVTVEFSSLDGWTDTDTNNCLALFDKYSVSDNLMIIDPVGIEYEFLQKFIEHNPKISVAVSTTEADFNRQSTIDSINGLMTGYNNIYVQLSPWGTYPTDTFIEYAKTHNYILASTIIMSKADLLRESLFSYGYTMIEVNNVYRIKDTVRDWADGLVKL